MTKKIFIFLNNKLLTLDLILPFMLELKKKKKSLDIEFISFDKKTLNIIKKNELLFDTINQIGKIKIFGNYFNISNKITKIIGYIIDFSRIIIINFFYNIVFIHFKALEFFPYNILYKINKKNCFYFDPNCWGYSDNIEKSYNLFFKRDINYKKIILLKSYSNLVTYSNESPLINYSKINNKNVFIINPTRSEKNWLAYSKNASQKYLKQEAWLKKKNNKNIYLLYILGGLREIDLVSGLSKEANSRKMFTETIKVLSKNKNIFVIFRPHAITNIKDLKSLCLNLNFNNYKISYMHTSVLSRFCKYTICNYFSFALADAWMSGSNVIEYTSYEKKMLEITNNKSIFPQFIDYFIDIREKKLLAKLLEKNIKFNRRKYNYMENNSKKELINKIIN